jgi:hypothetical protein
MDLDDFITKLDEWTSNSNKEFRNIVDDVMNKGKLNSAVKQAIAIEAAFTQLRLKEKYGSTVTLYRGVDGAYAKKINQAAQNKSEVTIKVNAADSWTSSKDTAKNFGDTILTAKVPVDRVVSSHLFNYQLKEMYEQENIVAWPKGKLKLKSKNISSGGSFYSSAEDKDSDEVDVDLTDEHNANWLHDPKNPVRIAKLKEKKKNEADRDN